MLDQKARGLICKNSLATLVFSLFLGFGGFVSSLLTVIIIIALLLQSYYARKWHTKNTSIEFFSCAFVGALVVVILF